jgi:hypothetical protein
MTSMLERLIAAATEEILSQLDPASPEWDATFTVTPFSNCGTPVKCKTLRS